jgi:predicted amidohydrolase YtcJ
MKYLRMPIFLFIVMLASCSVQEKADLVILNGKVLTIDSENPSVEAIAIKGETIIAVGSTKKIAEMIENGVTDVIDAHGRLVIPGFNDAHVHFGPLDPDFIELRYTTDPSVITEKVKAQVAKSKPGELIHGGHWVHELFPDKNWPSKDLIDMLSRNQASQETLPILSAVRSRRILLHESQPEYLRMQLWT